MVHDGLAHSSAAEIFLCCLLIFKDLHPHRVFPRKMCVFLLIKVNICSEV